MKKYTIICNLFVIVILFFVLLSCDSTSQSSFILPDITGLDEATAKTFLASKSLIPKVVYEYTTLEEEGNVFKTSPNIGSNVNCDDIIIIYISKGPSLYYLSNAVGRMWNVNNIDSFNWGNENEQATKGFYTPYVIEGKLYIDMYLMCKSSYSLEFYRSASSTSTTTTFGTASINDTFDKTVPIDIIFDNYKVDNNGGKTNFTASIPLSDLGVQKPTNIYLRFDFLVNNQRETFKASFDLSW